MQEDHSPYSS
uniref:Uncharacterized protein n=1 Tax=Anguilla anguilla TaxID=7936 RepID=A0A0E9Y0P1_ANGAN